MLTFIFLDYKSAEGTIRCILHYIQKCQNSKIDFSFVVVDNSVDDDNFRQCMKPTQISYHISA